MSETPVRAWELERYLLGELPRDRMEEIDRLEREVPEVRKKIHELRQSNAAILQQYPVESIVPLIRDLSRERTVPPGSKKSRTIKRLLIGVPILAAATLAAVIVLFKSGSVPAVEGLRIKGLENIDTSKSQILVYRKTGEKTELLKNGSLTRSGDLIQVVYVPGGEIHGAILSIDGNGIVTLHHPSSVQDKPDLGDKKIASLSNAYELDDAPLFERFFFITAKSPFEVRDILTSARLLAEDIKRAETDDLDLPPEYSQYTILLKKEKNHEI